MMFSVIPETYITKNVATMEMGIARLMMPVLLKLRRKR